MNCCMICDMLAALIALPLFIARHWRDHGRHRAYLRNLECEGWRFAPRDRLGNMQLVRMRM